MSTIKTSIQTTAKYVAVACPEGSLLDEPYVRIPLITAYTFVFLLCFLGNSFTIIVICFHSAMRTATNFFLANLAFADLLVSIFCIMQNMYHIVGSFNGHWPFGKVVCKLYVMVLHMVPCTGIGILVCVSVEKYIAVLHPLLALKILTKKLRVLLIASVWIISFLFNLPYYFATMEVRYKHLAACTRDTNGYGTISTRDMITISFVLWYCVPLLTIVFLYTRIGIVLWNSNFERVAINNTSENNATTTVLSATSTVEKSHDGCSSVPLLITINNTNVIQEAKKITVTSNENCKKYEEIGAAGSGSAHINDVLESRKKVIRLLIAIVCSLATLTLPHHIRLLYSIWTDKQMCNSTLAALFQPLTYICIFLSSSINPILYAFMSRRFCGAVKDIIKCRNDKKNHTRTRTFLFDILPSGTISQTHLNSNHYLSAEANTVF